MLRKTSQDSLSVALTGADYAYKRRLLAGIIAPPRPDLQPAVAPKVNYKSSILFSVVSCDDEHVLQAPLRRGDGHGRKIAKKKLLRRCGIEPPRFLGFGPATRIYKLHLS